MPLLSVNPENGERLAAYDEHRPDEVARILDESVAAFRAGREASFAERAAWLTRAAGLLEERQHDLARLMALEMGKPLAQGRAETLKCASACRYYAAEAEGALAPESVATDATRSLVVHRPLGVVLAVMPWNFPLWQVFRFAAPALMAGNAGLLKHSSNVTGCALAIEELLHAAGVPTGLFRTLRLSSPRVAGLIASPQVAAVTLTGSTPAGRAVAAAAGQALKKTVLELGGSDPYVVLADADLPAAAEACAVARLVNSGQSCIAGKRFIVVAEVAGSFERLFAERLAARRLGSALEEGVDIGPQARPDLRDELHGQVQRSLERGARLVLGAGGRRPCGAFYPATLLADVRPGTAAFDEETFGPVAALSVARDEAQALELANRSSFGLGAAVFTRDAARGERLAVDALEAGSCFVNTFVRSDPRLPFGGIKESGYGRELGPWGLREFVNVKTVYVK